MMLKLRLDVQNLSMEDAGKLMQAIASLGGTANGKVFEINLDTGGTVEEKFIANNVVSETLFKEDCNEHYGTPAAWQGT